MRIGTNPAKLKKKIEGDSYHRIIIPIYIPNTDEGYFKEALTILKYCLESLLKTIHSKTKISLFNNACSVEVISYLEKIYNENDCIDQLFHSKNNVGKINALYSAIKSNVEPLITITDADVMFLPKWQESVEKIFLNFPEAGMVSPVPFSGSGVILSERATTTLYYGISKRNLKFHKVIKPQDLIKFQKSIGGRDLSNIQLEKYLIVSNNGKKAVCGCGHFVATLRSEVFQQAPNYPTSYKISEQCDNRYIDLPNNNSGYLRLSTLENYAYHLGNKPEPWMSEKFNLVLTNKNIPEAILTNIKLNGKPLSKYKVFIGKCLRKLLKTNYSIKVYYFKNLGMEDPDY